MVKALQAANMGVWDYDLQTGKITWSPEHDQLFGLNSGTFDGRYETFETYIHPSDRQGVQQSIQQAITQKGNLNCKFRMV